MNWTANRRDLVNLSVIVLVTLMFYLLTMPSTITLEDAGLFQMVCHLGGLGHPPGYPLYILMCNAWVNLPFFDPSVFAGNLLSAVTASASCVIVYLISQRLSKTVGLITALTYGLSATFWSQAIIIEVYCLAALNFFLCVWLATRLTERVEATRLALLVFCYALALSNHWPLTGLATPALLCILLPALRPLTSIALRGKGFWLSVLALIAGLSPYLTLLRADPEISVYGGPLSAADFFDYVSRTIYGDVDSQNSTGLRDKLAFTRWVMLDSSRQLGWVALPVLIYGAVRSMRLLTVSQSLAVGMLYFGTIAALLLALDFAYDYYWLAIFRPYLIIAYMPLAFWFAIGCQGLALRLKQVGVTKGLRILTILALMASIPLANFNANNRNSDLVDSYARDVLNSLPPNAVLFTNADNESFPFGYLHLVEGLRADVLLLEWQNLVLPDRIASPRMPLEVQAQQRQIFLDTTTRPVYALNNYLQPSRNLGVYFEYSPGNNLLPVRNSTTDRIMDRLLYLAENNLVKDPHERVFLYERLRVLSRYYIHIARVSDEISEADNLMLDRLRGTFTGRLILVEQMLQLPGVRSLRDQILAVATLAAADIPPETPVQDIALLYEYLGRLMLIHPINEQQATAYFRDSLEWSDRATNKSGCFLEQLENRQDNTQYQADLSSEFPLTHCEASER